MRLLLLALVGGAQSRLGSAQCQFFNGKDFGGPGAQAQGVGTQADCCSACVGNAQCKASVWVKTPTFTGCYLKYSIKQPITCSNGCVACIPGAGPPPPPPHSDGSFALKADLTGPKFFDGFDFFTAKDPTLGFVTYLNKTAAFAAGLAGVNSAGHVFMRADHTAGGTLPRRSVRVTSKQVFDPKMLSADTAGAILVVVDIAHMPTGCGVWPAFWMESSSAQFQWPLHGEIDIIESVNNRSTGASTLHTSDGCVQSEVPKTSFSGTRVPACVTYPCPAGSAPATDCYVHAGGQRYNQGCGISPPASASAYGPPFNSAGGGVYAFLWDHSPAGVALPVPHDGKMATWFFDRQHIPPNLAPHLGEQVRVQCVCRGHWRQYELVGGTAWLYASAP
jgi:hypothetical protein